MIEETEAFPLPTTFWFARGRLARARSEREKLIELWNSMHDTCDFTAWVEPTNTHIYEVWCTFYVPERVQNVADTTAACFIRAAKDSLDACVLAAASVASQSVTFPDPAEHAMPLISDPAEFDRRRDDDLLLGLRPDQVTTLRDLQPFSANPFIRRTMQHLQGALESLSDEIPLFAVWANEAILDLTPPSGATILNATVDPPGIIRGRKRLATLEVEGVEGRGFGGGPGASFDPVLNAAPWPTHPDDNLSRRTHALLVIIEGLIKGLERSVDARFRTDVLTTLLDLTPPVTADRTWRPVAFDDPADEQDARDAVAASTQGLGMYRSWDGNLTYLRVEADRVLGREIPLASKLISSDPHGTAVETATRAAAGRYGLPDLVLEPLVVTKGSGIREVGDGTILSGHRGIALQVKARNVTTDTELRAQNWLVKNAAAGLRQARGTIKTLSAPRLTLRNLREREITFAGASIDWVPVVVLDHPSPPMVTPQRDSKGPSVVLLRRDWEFLWNQLRSATAIVDYAHRVSREDPIALGTETGRYFDLAYRDSNSSPQAPPEWLADAGATFGHVPTLPRDPASAEDELGHAVFQRVLEDIARTTFTGDEAQRVSVLALIDRVAVATRAELGRTLLQRLAKCAAVQPGEHRVEHRTMYVDDGDLHLSFTTMTQLTGYVREIHKNWVLHRRQTFLTRSGARGPVWPWTVSVLLTPCISQRRPWDTTVLATNGPPQFDEEEYARLEPIMAVTDPESY